jgi:hypothetical protein
LCRHCSQQDIMQLRSGGSSGDCLVRCVLMTLHSGEWLIDVSGKLRVFSSEWTDRYWFENWGNLFQVGQDSGSPRAGQSGDRILVGAAFSAPVQTGPGAHPASYTMGTGSFPGVKRPGCGVDHPTPSNAEVKERVEVYFYFSSGPSWPVLGWNLPLLYLHSGCYSGSGESGSLYRVIKKSLCTCFCIVIVRCTETFWSSCK